MLHLRFCMQGAYYAGETKHPKKVMEVLGIKYSHSTPQSMKDCWWFWNCDIDSLERLPEYLSLLEVDPMECVGFGLSQSGAEAIRDFKYV